MVVLQPDLIDLVLFVYLEVIGKCYEAIGLVFGLILLAIIIILLVATVMILGYNANIRWNARKDRLNSLKEELFAELYQE